MKTPTAVTLIIMGALLVMTPALADFAYQRNIIELMGRVNATNVMLAGQMEELYRFGCWLTGSAMVGVAVLASMRQTAQAHPRSVEAPIA
jgi:ABC-type spermidine/putrescine transport system permease subunit I